jgi:enoyl-CoA hydratase
MYRIRMPRGVGRANSWRRAKRAVNQTLDVQGFYAAIQSVFDIHQTGHGTLSVSGMPILMLLDGMKAKVSKSL